MASPRGLREGRGRQKRPPDGRGAKGKETKVGQEPKGARGLGASLREVGWDRIRRQRDSATGVKEARGLPARSLARRGHSLRKGSVLLV